MYVDAGHATRTKLTSLLRMQYFRSNAGNINREIQQKHPSVGGPSNSGYLEELGIVQGSQIDLETY